VINPIVYAVPVFLLTMAIEWWISRRRGLDLYRAADTVSSLSLGVISQLVGAFSKAANLGIYTLVFTHLAWRPLPMDALWVWLVALLAYDFCYYWLHRMGHEINILWAAHVVHHSSEEYNLSTALRQTGTGFLLGWVFYLPMAVMGVPPLVFAVVGLIDLLYQYWVHTRLVGKLGWVDRVLVTPSNHRVHHGQNDYCLDRNYGGILILWDRLFGTFVDEHDDEPIVYGIRGQLGSWSPWRANVHVYAALWQDMRLTKRLGDKLRVLFKHPGWRPADAAAAAPKVPYELAHFVRYAPPLPEGMRRYALAQLAMLMGLTLHFMVIVPQVSAGLAALVALGIGLHLAALSRLTEQGRAAVQAEWWRLALGALMLAVSPGHGWAWMLLPAASALAWGKVSSAARRSEPAAGASA
jgi:sterol desaturase/sphingolipid hydroxylase (fatty acid hydroxylase superfamily)